MLALFPAFLHLPLGLVTHPASIQVIGLAYLPVCIQCQWYSIYLPVLSFYGRSGEGSSMAKAPDLLAGTFQGLIPAYSLDLHQEGLGGGGQHMTWRWHSRWAILKRINEA